MQALFAFLLTLLPTRVPECTAQRDMLISAIVKCIDALG